jgi:hypothetical protein
LLLQLLNAGLQIRCRRHVAVSAPVVSSIAIYPTDAALADLAAA